MYDRFRRPLFGKRSGSHRRRQPRPKGSVPRIEVLERRQLLTTTIYWNSSTSGDWGTAANWMPQQVPNSTDNVVINESGATPTITISSADSESVLSLIASDPLSITGGSLTVAANSMIGDGLSMTGGSLTANGMGIALTVSGTTAVTGADLTAEGGASLILPQLASYTGGSGTTTLKATGTGSNLTLANLTTVTEAYTNYGAEVQFEAVSGGTVTLTSLQSIDTATVVLDSADGGSVLDAPALTTFENPGSWTYSALEASDGGALDVGDLASLETTNLDIAGPDEGLTLATVTTFSYANITVSGGATLSLPGVTSFTANGGNDILEATGTGSVLTLANLTTVTQAYNDYGAEVQFEAVSAGTVTLPSLQTIETGTVVLDRPTPAVS